MSSDRWSTHDAEWRDPRQVVALWAGGERPSLRTRVRGRLLGGARGRLPARHARVRAPRRGAGGRRPDAHGAPAPVRAGRLGRARDGGEHAQPQPAGRAAAGRRRGEAARPGAHGVPSRRALPARARVRRRRPARERRRPERGRPARPRARRARVVAEGDRDGRGARLLAQLPAAQLDRGRVERGVVVLLRVGRPDVGAPAGPPQLPGRPPRGDLLRPHARAGRLGPHAAALGPPPRGRALGRQLGLRRGRRRRRRPLRGRRPPARLDARARVPRRRRAGRHVARDPALPHVRARARPRALGLRGARGRHAQRRGARLARLARGQPDLRRRGRSAEA